MRKTQLLGAEATANNPNCMQTDMTRQLQDMKPVLPRWQRVADVLIAGLMLLILSPVIAFVAIAVWLNMGRPIFFRQIRPGLLARDITMTKFRTMDTKPYSSANISPDAARITRLGAFLRKTSLDELPELWMVVRGEMSLVGPRPLLVEYLPYYTPKELKRFLVRPGLTGLAQISGRNMLDWNSRLELDARYAKELLPRLYFSVLFKTIIGVLRSDGVSVDAYAVGKPLHVERASQASSVRCQNHPSLYE
jgi:lipopolysaccharide/colanic/teichoic acid biosynthesis glycosyltransferase